MDAKIKAAYENARRFDEGELYQSKEYDDVSEKRYVLEERLETLFGADAISLLDQFANVIYEENALENLHFFEQGYLTGQADK